MLKKIVILLLAVSIFLIGCRDNSQEISKGEDIIKEQDMITTIKEKV